MASIATIQTAQNRLTIKGGAQGSFSFTITNIFGSTMNMGAEFTGEDSSTKSWIKIEPPVEREVKDQASDTYVINVDIPEDAAPGEYKFNLLLYSVENPNLDYSQSDPVVVVVPEQEKKPEPPKKSKWWI